MAGNFTKEILEQKYKQRLALRKEYLKQLTNPHAEPGGHIFDPAIQRFQAMKVTKIEHFRETPKTILRGFGLIVLPLGFLLYYIKKDRDEAEARLRAGEVAYRDRRFKFQ